MLRLASIFFAYCLATSADAAVCPSGCVCPPDTLQCMPNKVTSIPQIAQNVKILRLQYNPFSSPTVQRRNFTNMTELTELNLKGCGIETLEYNTFADLTKLKMLDLSMNNIKLIADQTFSSLRLDYLYLGENPNIILPPTAFNGMTTGLLSLEKCGLTQVNPAIFVPLQSTLRKLYLNNNRIETFQIEMLDVFNRMDFLRIHDNPLSCGCEARWLKNFYDSRMDLIRDSAAGSSQDPRCASPNSVAGEFFSTLSQADFACEKPTLAATVSFTETQGTLTCTSRGTPMPMVAWYRPNGQIQQSDPSPNMVINKVELVLRNSDTDVHGQYRCIASNVDGNVSLSVNVTWPFNLAQTNGVGNSFTTNCPPQSTSLSPKDVDVTDSNKPVTEEQTNNVFKTKYFTIVDLISAVLGTFIGTLVVCVVVLHFCVYRRKEQTSNYSSPALSDYSANSMKQEGYPPVSHHIIQNRPLPVKPYPKLYDENHYMSTNLDERDEFLHMGQHGDTSPPCEACRTMNSSRFA